MPPGTPSASESPTSVIEFLSDAYAGDGVGACAHATPPAGPSTVAGILVVLRRFLYWGARVNEVAVGGIVLELLVRRGEGDFVEVVGYEME